MVTTKMQHIVQKDIIVERTKSYGYAYDTINNWKLNLEGERVIYMGNNAVGHAYRSLW